MSETPEEKKSRKKLEKTYGRPMAIRSMKMMGGSWDGNANMTFPKRNGNKTGIIPARFNVDDTTYEGGRPDGFVALPLLPDLPALFVCVEVKAFAGTIFLGDPADESDTHGWHQHQRVWYAKKALPFNRLYYIYLWVYPERQPARITQKRASAYLVPPDAWTQLETQLSGRKSIAATQALERETAYKPYAAECTFAPYRLNYKAGAKGTPNYFEVPLAHPIYHVLGRIE